MAGQIDKVEILPRKLIQDDRGWFLKVITGTEKGLPAATGEVYCTMGRPGQTKGGHYHLLAVEWFTVIEGAAVLRLEDVVTHVRRDIELSLERVQTVFIPNMVAHSVVNTGDTEFVLLAYTDRLYDPADTIPYEIA